MPHPFDSSIRNRTNSVLFSYGLTRVWAPPLGLYYSFGIHAVIFLLLAFSAPLDRLLFPIHVQIPPELATTDHEILVLPNLGGGSEGNDGGHAGSGGAPHDGTQGSSGGSLRAGVVYHGRQPIVSNPDKPDNFVQTIRQPDLVSPPKLPFPIPVPNMVLMAARPAIPVLAKSPVPPPPPTASLQSVRTNQALQGMAIAPQAPPPPRLDPPKLTLPPSGVDAVVTHPTATMPVLAVKSAPVAASPHTVESNGTDERNLLVINGIDLPINSRPIIPAGEASGAFTVIAAAAGAAHSSDTVGVGTGTTGSGTGNSGTGNSVGPGAGSGGNGTGSGTGTGPGSGTGSGTGNGTGIGTGPGTGTGTGTGGSGNSSGSGTGHGKGNGPGTGSGAGPGSGPFRDITIVGGSSATGLAKTGGGASIPSNAARQYSYGMSIVASGASGGGLRDFGVFRNEVVYTVYLPADPQTRGPQWVLQYASTAPVGESVPRGVLTPPYPVSRENARFPSDIALRNAGRLIVMYGVINASGKLENAKIMDSPNPLLNTPLLDATANWVFKPAEFNGQPVAVRILLGIPITSSMPF